MHPSNAALNVIQLVPHIGGGPNGVADYAVALGRLFGECKQLSNTILAASSGTAPEELECAGYRTHVLHNQQARVLADTIDGLSDSFKRTVVLLHFSGYGYHKRGIP